MPETLTPKRGAAGWQFELSGRVFEIWADAPAWSNGSLSAGRPRKARWCVSDGCWFIVNSVGEFAEVTATGELK